MDSGSATPQPRSKWPKIVIILILVTVVVTMLVFSSEVKATTLSLLKWIQENSLEGSGILIVIYVLFTILFIPGSLLTLGIGFIYSYSTGNLWLGTLLGTLIVFIGSNLGAVLAFLLSRYLFKEAVIAKFGSNKKYKVLLQIIGTHQVKFVILLRLCPLIPFNVLNYLLGITGIKVTRLLLGNLGMLPGTVLYVYLGAASRNISQIF